MSAHRRATSARAPTCSARSPGRGLPAIEPGMPMPAGTGLTRRTFVARSLGLALSVYGAGRLELFEEGIAAAATGPQSPILVTRLPAGRRRRAVAALPGRRSALPQVPDRRSPSPAGTPFAEDTAPLLASGARAARAAARRGQGLRAAGDRLRPPRPVALHVAPLLGGRRDRYVGLLTGWMGRYLDAVGTRRQPAAGPLARPARCSRRSRPRKRARSRRSTAPTSTASGRPACGARSRPACSTRSARSGACRHDDPALRTRRRT